MYAKIEISGVIEVVTGMHIGGSTAFSAIGAIDSPVIKDARTNVPMLPGSSLKGKMRSLLAKRYNERVVEPNDDAECIVRLFGNAKQAEGHVHIGRLLFADTVVENMEDLHNAGLTGATEVKFENSIKRTTAEANPRQIERVVRGAKFPLQLIYEVKVEDDEQMIEQDFAVLKEGLQLLQYDYLGGSGSRGYGRVKITDLNAKTVVGKVDDEVLEKCQDILSEACAR